MEDIIEGVQTVGTKAGLELLLACLPERHRFIEQPGAAHRQADRGFAMILAAPGHLDQAEAVQHADIAADRRAVELGEMAQFGETDRLAPGNRAHQRILRDVDAKRRQRFVIDRADLAGRSEEHTSELQSLMLISYAVFCLKK